MKPVLVALCIAVGLCVVAVHQVDRFLARPGQAAALTASAKTSPARAAAPLSAGLRSITLDGDKRGHFQVDARVDGRHIDFLIDTGASAVVLRESAARRLGIFPSPRDYTVKTQTANGVGRAAPVQLGRVEVGGISVNDVTAFVMSDEALQVNLLGMTFLSRIRWTHDHGRLVLAQ